MYRDGATVGLYLQVTSAEAKSWLYRYMLNGKARAMGLGSAMTGQVSLAEARQMAQEARKQAGAGLTHWKQGTQPQRPPDSKPHGLLVSSGCGALHRSA